MKHSGLSVFILMIAVFLGGCVSTPRLPTNDAAIEAARSADFSLDTNYPAEKFSYILESSSARVKTIDGNNRYGAKGLLVKPGSHDLRIMGFRRPEYAERYVGGEPLAFWVAGGDTVSFVFEPGKYYFADLGLFSGFGIKEITDPALIDKAKANAKAIIETTKKYLAFFKNNPSHLAGAWDATIAASLGASETSQFVFDANGRFRHNQTNNTRVVEGRYFFNEDSIVLFPETYNTADMTRFNTRFVAWQLVTKTLSYTLAGDVLTIAGFGLTLDPWTGIDWSGAYRRKAGK
ncbi:MAG: hypothetical protein LBE33_08300 [Zoogloeaceae bacterium]|jgi:hypothetical protein|nr:hypothetical protein [Zoogloeaceae bacterium]